MARASQESGYTLGALRRAVECAQKAEDSRDTYLFGQSQFVSHSSIAKSVALHFRDEDDAFILPQVELVHEEDGTAKLQVGGDVICSDFQKFERSELAAIRKDAYDDMDTKNITKKHGEQSIRVPSLEMLCIR